MLKYEIVHQIKSKQYLLEILEDQVDNLYSDPVYLFPFEIISGASWLTNNGLRAPLNTNNGILYTAQNNTQSTLIINGNQPLNVAWLNSYNPTYDINALQQGFKKNFQVGDYFTCFVNDTFTITKTQEQFNIFNQEYINLQADIDVTLNLQVKEGIKLNFQDLLQKVYIIKGGDFSTNQLFQLNSITAVVNSTTLKTQSYNLNLTSINFDYAQSGKQIFQGFNFGFPGNNFAFPDIDENNNIILNQTFLTENFGITSIQETRDFAHNFSTWELVGGIADKDNILPLQKLLVYEPLVPINDDLQLQGATTNDYFVWWQANPAYDFVADNFKEPINNASYNNWSRDVVGGLKQQTGTTETNALQGETYFPYYNPNWIIKNNTTTALTYRNLTSKYLPHVQSFTIPVNKELTLAQWWNLNSIIYENYVQYTTELTQSSKFSFSQVPILGKLWNIINFGFDPTWNLSTNTIQPSLPLNLLTPISQFNLAKAVATGANTPIDLNFYNNGENLNSNGGKLNIGSFHWSITDRLKSVKYKLTTYTPTATQQQWDTYFGNQPLDGVYNTYYLGQTTNPDGSAIEFPTIWYDDTEITPFSPSPQGTLKGFYIGGMKTYGVGSNNIFFTFYTNQQGSQLPTPVYFNIMKSAASISKIFPFWCNVINFNTFSVDILENIREAWPNVLIPLTPPNTSNIIMVDNQNIGTPIYHYKDSNVFNARTTDGPNLLWEDIGDIKNTNFNTLFGSILENSVSNTTNTSYNLTAKKFATALDAILAPVNWDDGVNIKSPSSGNYSLNLWSPFFGQRPQQNVFKCQGTYFQPVNGTFNFNVNIKNYSIQTETPINTPTVQFFSNQYKDTPTGNNTPKFTPIIEVTPTRDNVALNQNVNLSFNTSFWTGTPQSFTIPINFNNYISNQNTLNSTLYQTPAIEDITPIVTTIKYANSPVPITGLTKMEYQGRLLKEIIFLPTAYLYSTINQTFQATGLENFVEYITTNDATKEQFTTSNGDRVGWDDNKPMLNSNSGNSLATASNQLTSIYPFYQTNKVWKPYTSNTSQTDDTSYGGGFYLDTDNAEIELVFTYDTSTNEINYETRLWVPYEATLSLWKLNGFPDKSTGLRNLISEMKSSTNIRYQVSNSPWEGQSNTSWEKIKEDSFLDITINILNTTIQ